MKKISLLLISAIVSISCAGCESLPFNKDDTKEQGTVDFTLNNQEDYYDPNEYDTPTYEEDGTDTQGSLDDLLGTPVDTEDGNSDTELDTTSEEGTSSTASSVSSDGEDTEILNQLSQIANAGSATETTGTAETTETAGTTGTTDGVKQNNENIQPVPETTNVANRPPNTGIFRRED